MPTVYHWPGLSQASLQKLASHSTKINAILFNKLQEEELSLKKHEQHALYTISLNQSQEDILLFTVIEKSSEPYLLVLDVIAGHDLQQSELLKSIGMLNFLGISTDDIHKIINPENYYDATSAIPSKAADSSLSHYGEVNFAEFIESPASIALKASADYNLELILGKLDLKAEGPLSPQQLFIEITGSDRHITKLFLLMKTDSIFSKALFAVMSPIFYLKVNEDGRLLDITYLQYIILRLTNILDVSSIFHLFYDYITPETINATFSGIPNINKNPSLLLFICINRLDLLISHWEFFRPLINPQALHRPLGNGGLGPPGITPFFAILLSEVGDSFVIKNWKYFKLTLVPNALHHPITTNDSLHGMTPFYYLTTLQSGRDLILKNLDHIKYFISIADWNRPVSSANAKHGGKTPIFNFAQKEYINNLYKYWDYFRVVLTSKGLSQVVTAKDSTLQGSSIFFNLCMPYEGTRLLLRNWKDFEPHLTSKLLSTPLIATGKMHSITSFYLLCSYADGLNLLLANWESFRKHIIKEVLLHKISGSGAKRGTSPFYLLCSHFLGQRLIRMHWNDFSGHITREILIELTPQGDFTTTPLHELCKSRDNGIAVMDENWDFFRHLLREEDFSIDCSDSDAGDTAESKYSPIHILSSHAKGREFLEKVRADFPGLTAGETPSHANTSSQTSTSLAAAQSSLMWSFVSIAEDGKPEDTALVYRADKV